MENKTKFFNIVLQCPLTDPDNDCIFSNYRKMSITELIEISQKIDSAELDRLLTLHNACLSKRKTKKLAS